MKIITISREFGSGGRELGKRLLLPLRNRSGRNKRSAITAAFKEAIV